MALLIKDYKNGDPDIWLEALDLGDRGRTEICIDCMWQLLVDL